eukprot:1139465-Pelagomonas_calceolata.AAC.1
MEVHACACQGICRQRHGSAINMQADITCTASCKETTCQGICRQRHGSAISMQADMYLHGIMRKDNMPGHLQAEAWLSD